MTLDAETLSAISRIFRSCDEDADGALSERELRQLHVRAFGSDLAPDESAGLLRLIAHHMPEGVRTVDGEELTGASGRAGFVLLPGFIFLIALLLERGAAPADDGSGDDGGASPGGGEAIPRGHVSPPGSGGRPHPTAPDVSPSARPVAAGLGGERAVRALLAAFDVRTPRLAMRASGAPGVEAAERVRVGPTSAHSSAPLASPPERSALALGDADRAGGLGWAQAAAAPTGAGATWRLLPWRRPRAGGTARLSERRLQLSTAGRVHLEKLLAAYFARATPSPRATRETEAGARAPSGEPPAARLLDCDALRALCAALPPRASRRARAAEPPPSAAEQQQARDERDCADADARAARALDNILQVPRGADGRPSAGAFATVAHVVDGVGALVLREPALAARLLALVGFSDASLARAIVPARARAHGGGGGFDAGAAEVGDGPPPTGPAAATTYVRCAVLDARACVRALSQPRAAGTESRPQPQPQSRPQPQQAADDAGGASADARTAPRSPQSSSPSPRSAGEELLLSFAARAPARCGPLGPRQRLSSFARPVRVDARPRAGSSGAGAGTSTDGFASHRSSSWSLPSLAQLAHEPLGARAQPGPDASGEGASVCLCLETVEAPREAPPTSTRALLASLRAYDCVAIAFRPTQEAASARSAPAPAPARAALAASACASDAQPRCELESEAQCARALHAMLTAAALDAVRTALATRGAAADDALFPPPMLLVRVGSAERGAAASSSGAERSADGASMPPPPLELEVSLDPAAGARSDAPFESLALYGIEDRATCAALAPISAAVKAAARARTRARISRALGAGAVVTAGCALALRKVGGARRLAGLVVAASTPLREAATRAARSLLDALVAHARALRRQGSELSQGVNASLLRLAERAASELAIAMPIVAGAIPGAVAVAADGAAVVADAPPRLRNWLSLTATGIGFGLR